MDDLRSKPELAFPWGEPAPDPEFQDAHGQNWRTCRYKMRLLCDPKEKPFACSYTHGRPMSKNTWDPTAQWLFMAQEGRVTAINRDETFRDADIALVLNKLKGLIPSLEGYATSAANDYWVVTHYGVQRERYSPALQDEAKRKWMANRKRPRRFQDSDDDDE